MTVVLTRPATRDGLFLWTMHRFAEVFEHHAIIKGGLALRLLDSPRSTTDIDYVFVPYDSKKDVLQSIQSVLAEIEGGEVKVALHSKMIRIALRVDDAAIQIEVNVAKACKATAMATGGFATANGQPSRVVRIMSLDCALAHKIAAWNERRLMRDLYDIYFLSARAKVLVDLQTLGARLATFESKLPALKRRKSMSLEELVHDLSIVANEITEKSVESELASLLPPEELAGLHLRLRTALNQLCERLSDVKA